jgi:hypothetical protein
MSVFGKWRRARLGRVPMNLTKMMQSDSNAAKHLENVFLTVVEYFRVTLEDSNFDVLVPRLNAVESELRGFAYEGAGMGLTLLDIIFPWKKRVQAFLAGPGSPYIYPVYVGVGLVLARVGRKPEPYLAQLDPLVGWFAIDGYGFRAGTLGWHQYIEERAIPIELSSSALHLFDQGMGRSLWFSTGADIDRLVTTIMPFPPERQADLWCGVGFACAYAGGVERPVIETLCTEAAPYQLSLARGAAIAAKARQRAGDLAPHTNLACEVLCGLSSHMAAHLTDVALQDLPTDSAQPAYEIWQRRIEAALATQAEQEAEREPRFV